jgi:imidazolonepropionase-like amidohydrolase
MPTKTYLRCRQLIDGTGASPRSDVTLTIEGDKIAEVRSGPFSPPPDATVIDLSDSTVMPGMTDAHCHILIEGVDLRSMYLGESSAAKAFRGLRNAQLALHAGFTTIRDPGDIDRNFAHLDVRDAINKGWFSGPRMFAAGHYLSITGGHGDLNDVAHEFGLGGFGILVDSPDQVRRAVREEIKYGADWIKFFATGGVLSATDDPALSAFTFEEMRVGVETASGLGRPVSAHAHGTRGISDAVRAGVRSIEHGTMLEEDTVEQMVERGTYLVPTAWVMTSMAAGENPMNLPNDSFDKARRMAEFHRRSIQLAHRAGVKIVTGTDVGVVPHGGNAHELVTLVDYGLKPMEAIVAATRTAAEMLRVEDRTGTLKAGMLADLIALPENPLQNIEAVLRVGFVMKGGEIIFDSLSKTVMATV